jgi:hypothetical protein
VDFEDCSFRKATNLIIWHGCVTLLLTGAQHFAFPITQQYSTAVYSKETNCKQVCFSEELENGSCMHHLVIGKITLCSELFLKKKSCVLSWHVVSTIYYIAYHILSRNL